MRDKMGDLTGARRALRRSLSLDPTEENARADYEALEYGAMALFRAEDPVWRSSEALARGRPVEALRILGSGRSVRVLQARARVHAVLGDREAVLSDWEGIARARGRVSSECADVFFVRDLLGRDPRWWRIIALLSPRAVPGVWQVPFLEGGRSLSAFRSELRRYARSRVSASLR